MNAPAAAALASMPASADIAVAYSGTILEHVTDAQYGAR